jgi:(p)ppGpp synthase/HD superfamily hydrolase
MVHLDGVVATLRDHGCDDPTLLAAAYLQHTVEDTKTTIQQIHDKFGQDVAELVYWLTDSEKGRRRIRKLMSAWRLSRAPLSAKLIKLADFIDNTPSVVEHDPKFAKVYLSEKAQTMGLMANVEGPALTELPLYLLALQADPKPNEPAHTFHRH